MKGAVAFLVSVDLEKTVRVNITAQESQINAIDREGELYDQRGGVAAHDAAQGDQDAGPPALGTIGATPPRLGVVEGGEIPYLPQAAEKKKQNFASRWTADPEIKCYLPGVPRATYMPFPFQILQGSSTIDRAGDFHSDALHVVERYKLLNKDLLDYEATIEDPMVFSKPWKINMPLYRRAEKNARLMEFECAEFTEELPYGNLRKKASQ
jgi:hypothetical protein